MRLKITLDNPMETALPVNYQHYLTSLVYRLLDASNADYSRFLHEEGYETGEGDKRFKMFSFSWLRPRNRHAFRVVGQRMWLAPGSLEWILSSPMTEFLQHSATGLLSVGTPIQVEDARFRITQVCTLPTPEFRECEHFTCLSPIVAAIKRPDGSTHYLRPSEGEAFSAAIEANLRRKHRLLSGELGEGERIRLEFSQDYLARTGGGTKKITYKEIDIVGAFAPFTLTGSLALMHTAWECGLGEKNSGGFGMIERAKERG